MAACQKMKEAVITDPKRVLDDYGETAEAESFNLVHVHCQSGVRSAIAMSALKARGYDNVLNIDKGCAGTKKQ